MRKIELSEHFDWRRLLAYSLPGIGETLAITSFQIVDGYFVSNLLGLIPFTAVNIISPLFFMFYGLGFMFGAGGSAAVSRLKGEGQDEQANRVFTMTVASMIAAGALIGTLLTAFMPALAAWSGAKAETVPYCVAYGRRMSVFLPFYLVNAAFLSLWITSEKAWLGLLVACVNGGLNLLLDWLFMGPLGWGVRGAALATSAGATVTAVITLTYFARKNNSSLRFTRFGKKEARELGGICLNGASEMVDSITSNATQLVMNNRLMRLIGPVGVAAMGVYSYVIELFLAVFFGISSTTINVVGYKFGEGKRKELDGLVRTGRRMTLLIGAIVCALCLAFAEPIAGAYLGYDAAARDEAAMVLRISSIACLLTGFILFCSSLFTGLGDGRTSALIALCNSFAAPVAMIYLLPAVFGPGGIWWAIPAGSVLTALLSAAFLRKTYPRRVAGLDP